MAGDKQRKIEQGVEAGINFGALALFFGTCALCVYGLGVIFLGWTP